MVRRAGKPFARIEEARFEFAGPGRRMSQWRKEREWEATIGWKINSSGSVTGEDSWTRVKRLRERRYKRRFVIVER